MKLTTEIIAKNAIVAALYIVLTLIASPISFGMVQFRISEILMILVFFNPTYVVGLCIGCAISNAAMSAGFLGSGGYIDILIGTAATLLSGLLMPHCKRLGIALLLPIIFNGVFVGLELCFINQINTFWICFGWVALGEFVVLLAGYIIFLILKRYKSIKSVVKLIDVRKNENVKW